MNSTITQFILFLTGLGILLSCEDDKRYRHQSSLENYDMTNPDILILPDTLREISSLTAINNTTVGCVQDENGILFIYDLAKKELKKQIPFTIDGDYEGSTRVGNTFYILRSDGVLFEIPDYTAPHNKVQSWATGIPAHNNEGLCYDEENQRLLIACKTKNGKGKQYKNIRAIYAFDLETKTLYQQPAFEFDLLEIRRFAQEENSMLESETGSEGEALPVKFRPSAICIHPFTHQLFLLSATDHMLFIFNPNGMIEHIEPLDPELFNKAEGITFFTNGDMLISNEAQDKKATLVRFVYRKHR